MLMLTKNMMDSIGSETQMNPTQVSDEELNLFANAMQITGASVFPMVLKSAIELDILEIIGKAGPGAFVSPKDIASQLPTKNPEAHTMLDRILRLLASYSVLNCSLRTLPVPDGKVERLYGLAPVCKFLTKNEDGATLSDLCLLNQDKVFLESWHYMKEAMLQGGFPFKKANGMSAYEYFGTNPRFIKIFNNGMSSHSTITMKKIVETYKGFEGLNSVVDVAGGIGGSLSMIISKYPSIKGINFDLPHVTKDAPAYPGVEHVGGDMFVSVPKGDAIFIKSTCHNWSDESCVKLFKNCYQAIPENGKVIVAEYILPVTPDPSSLASKIAINIDCIMLANSPGGKERTEQEFKSLAMAAGFLGFRVVGFAFETYIMEFLKKP